MEKRSLKWYLLQFHYFSGKLKLNPMKKLLLTIAVIALNYLTYAQVVCAGVSPAQIAGNYEFTWASPANGDWGTPDFLIPGEYIEGELVLVDDGSAGTSPVSGLPNANYGCAASPTDAYLGKIAVVYRYDNSGLSSPTYCGFADKALNAMNAGAIGVIIVNREPGVVGMAGGTVGIDVTIPVVMLSDQDGANLRAEMENGPVTMFIGNKTGLYFNDAGITKSTALTPKAGAVASQLAVNDTEFNFDLGARIYNYGSLEQNNLVLNATITDPSSSIVYDEDAVITSILPTDSADVDPTQAINFPPFSLTSYPAGRYKLTYTLSLVDSDEYPADNTLSFEFVVTDSIYGKGRIDATTGLPVGDAYYRPGGTAAVDLFGICTPIYEPNASRIGAAGIYFSATTSTEETEGLVGQEFIVKLYKWEDQFVDLNDLDFPGNTWTLTDMAYNFYNFTEDLQGETVYAPFTQPILLEDNTRYLACVETPGPNVYLGFDSKSDYTWNTDYYLQPTTPNFVTSGATTTYYASGFGADLTPAIGVRVFDADELGYTQTNLVSGSAYPNPAVDAVTISLDADGIAILNVTDLAGRTVQSSTVTLVNGKTNINISELNNGAYIFNVLLEDGKSAKFNVVKK